MNFTFLQFGIQQYLCSTGMDAKPTVLYKPQQQQQRADESVTGVEIMAQAEKKQRAVSSDDMNRIFKHWAFAKKPVQGQRPAVGEARQGIAVGS